MTQTSTTTYSGNASAIDPGNPIRGRFNEAFFRVMDGYLNSLLSSHKSELFTNLPATVVEIGSGTGANFRYFSPGTKVIAVEPNPYMHRTLKREAAKAGIELTLLSRGAEDTGLEPESIDAVVSTLVLCTVPDLDASIREIRRVLRPGGQFFFLEHVAAPQGSILRWIQQIVHRPWSYCFEGCQTNRDIFAALEQAGFEQLRADRYTVRSPFLPVNTQIVGVATQ